MKRIYWARQQDSVGGSAKALLVELAICFDVARGYCCYGTDKLANSLGLTERTVYRAVKDLEKKDLITVERHKHRTNKYRLRFA